MWDDQSLYPLRYDAIETHEGEGVIGKEKGRGGGKEGKQKGGKEKERKRKRGKRG